MTSARPSSIKEPNLPQEILALLKSLFPQRHENIPLHEPHFSGNERRYIKDCINSTFVSYVGKYVEKFLAGQTAHSAGKDKTGSGVDMNLLAKSGFL